MKQKAITLILILISAIVPLCIVPDKTNNNYNIIKFIILLVAGLALLILLLGSYKTLTMDKKDILILIFMGLVFISAFFSNNIKTAIIGANNRYEGLPMFATYICIYLCAKKYFNIKKKTIILNIMFIISMIIGILGIAQKYVNYEDLYPIFNKGICSTFGNSNFFGSFISLVLPISIATFIFTGTKKGFILSLVMFFNMISSCTRSAWVAFAFVGIIGLIYLIKQKNKQYFKRTLIIITCFVIIFIYLLNGFNFIFNKFTKESTEKQSTISETQRKINIIKQEITKATKSGLSEEMGSSRISIWKLTLLLMSKKPILGCGPDNLWFGLVENCEKEIYQFVNKHHVAVDKAHNEYLQIGATIGIPALICYITFILLILIPKTKLNLNNKTCFIIYLSLISYLIQAFFNISTIGVAPLFWILLGLIDNENIINNRKEIYGN